MYTHTYIDMCVYVHMWPAVELTALVLLDSGGGGWGDHSSGPACERGGFVERERLVLMICGLNNDLRVCRVEREGGWKHRNVSLY